MVKTALYPLSPFNFLPKFRVIVYPYVLGYQIRNGSRSQVFAFIVKQAICNVQFSRNRASA